jgi:hypothetical protein
VIEQARVPADPPIHPSVIIYIELLTSMRFNCNSAGPDDANPFLAHKVKRECGIDLLMLEKQTRARTGGESCFCICLGGRNSSQRLFAQPNKNGT